MVATTTAPVRVERKRRPPRPTRSPTASLKRIPARLLIVALLVIELFPLVWLFVGSVKSQSDHLNRSTLSLPTH
jgi:raffinose/stachyose/melibiose transport system permease protein